MIAYIKGVLEEKSPVRIVVEAAGVGYELLIPLSTYDRLPKTGESIKVFAWHCVREDDELLFGFATPAERELFLKLTEVSGVGPKIALSILSGGSVSELALAITSGQVKRISSIKGVGKKTAEKICLELKDKINAFEALSAAQRNGEAKSPAAPALRDAMLALSALGFSEETANKMVGDVVAKQPDAVDVETIVRLALSSNRK